MVRDMLLLWGYKVGSYPSEQAGAQHMDHLRDLYSTRAEDNELRDFVRNRLHAREAMRRNRTRFIIWLLGGLGLAVIGAAVTSGAQWLKAVFP
jgi:hypothetical protein